MTRIATVLTAAVLVAGCASDPAETPATRTSLGSAPAGGLTVELLADGRLETGLTPLYVQVRTAGGEVVTDADVTFEPMMAMSGGMSHSAPVLGPATPGSEGLYRCHAVFQMPTSTMGAWSAKVGVTRPGAARVEASFPSLVVADSGRAKVFSHFDPDSAVTTRYIASIRFHAPPRVGLNPLTVTLHRRQDMMTFPPVDDATVSLDPQMPSMGHGSPGSVDPVLATSGVYEGELSFSMAGEWETAITFVRSGVTVGAPKFTTAF